MQFVCYLPSVASLSKMQYLFNRKVFLYLIVDDLLQNLGGKTSTENHVSETSLTTILGQVLPWTLFSHGVWVLGECGAVQISKDQ